MNPDNFVLVDELEMMASRAKWEISTLATAIEPHRFFDLLSPDDLDELGNTLELSPSDKTALAENPILPVRQSFVQGYPCFVVSNGPRELLFARQQHTPAIGQSLANMDERVNVMRDLDCLWHDKFHDYDLKDIPPIVAVTRFSEQNRDALEAYRIPLLAVIDAPNESVEAFCRSWDTRNLTH